MSLNFSLSEDQEMIRDTVRKFAEDELKEKAKECDEKEEFSYELTAKMAEQGLFGMHIPEEWDGGGMDYLSYVIAVEELARVDGSQAATVAAENSLGIGPLYEFGNDEQRRKYLPKLCSGEALWGFGLTEPLAGSDAGGSKTKAVQDGDDWIINGSKIFITNGSSDITIGSTVQAVTGVKANGKHEMTCFIVESGTKGFEQKTMKDKMMWRGSNTAELYFEDVRVPKENMLGKRGDGFKQMLMTLDKGRLSIGAMGLGCAQGAFEEALKYTKEREQFDRRICDFQVNAFKLADMDMEIELARNLLYKATWLYMNKMDFSKISAMAKLYCSEVAYRVVNHAVQLHGGYGLMKEYNVEKFYRDQKLLEIGEGTSEVQRIVISRHLGCNPM